MNHPLKTLIWNTAKTELEAINNAMRAAVLALEVERSNIGSSHNDFDQDLQAILGLGALMSDLQVQRSRAQKISQQMPSPNQVAPKDRAKVSAISAQLFEAMGHIRNIQKEVYRLARLNLRSASHKVNFAVRHPKGAAKVPVTESSAQWN